MTSIRPDTETLAADRAADRAQTFVDWTKVNAKALTIGAAVVVIAAAGFWFYQRSQAITAGNAERALANAKQSLTAGNLQLAQTDLQSVYSRYGSTTAGVEAAMLLAQIDYDAAKYQDGISILEKVAGSGGSAGVEATIRSLEGDGYAQMGKLAEAAKRYESAADATTYETEKAYQRAKAARAYQSAGDTSKARQIWSSLEADPKAQSMVAEARVRLGELTARPEKK